MTEIVVACYRDLLVWQKALDWAEAIYQATARWPREERFGLVSQVRRSAISVASNIAEGAAGRTTGEFVQFVGVAQGSLAEAETQLLLAQRLGYVAGDDADALLGASAEIGRMLAGLASSLRRRKDA
ncbi:MAG: four helix bundle protein [Pseudomonadota bacterium]|nr:four helix bundle protein [Pseudomonadota bacterium]